MMRLSSFRLLRSRSSIKTSNCSSLTSFAGQRAVSSSASEVRQELKHINGTGTLLNKLAAQKRGSNEGGRSFIAGAVQIRWYNSPVESKPPDLETSPINEKSPTYLNSLPLSIRRLAMKLPAYSNVPPSAEVLVKLTNSWWSKIKIRFKWITIRSYRQYRADDYSAFFSVGLTGTLTWFFISTTSFLAVIFGIFNSLSLQEWIATKLGNYLTKSTGVIVVFESAIVPRWGVAGGGSKILFKNVYISRGIDQLGSPLEESIDEGMQRDKTEEELNQEEIFTKWTKFHLSIDTVEVSLSLSRWLDGNGLVREASVTGVRGVIDRSHVVYDPDAPLDRYAYRHVSHPGDFYLESLQIQDFLLTVYQPDNFRPYTFSIFNADIKKLRKQWLFYDLLSANSITGQVDNCLFSLHKPQSINKTFEQDLKDATCSKMTRFRVDGVPIDHMQTAADGGVLSWVKSGRCDLVADIRFPAEPEDEIDLSAIVADLVEKIDKEFSARSGLSSNNGGLIPGQRVLKGEALEVPKGWKKDVIDVDEGIIGRIKKVKRELEKERERYKAEKIVILVEKTREELLQEEELKWEEKKVSFDLDIRFKDLKASVPIFTTDLSYVNNALVRPIVAFLNSNKTLIPIKCHFDLTLDDFDGSWTTYDCGILDRTFEQVYEALEYHVQTSNERRIQHVSLWTLRLTAEAVLSAFKKSWGDAENGIFV